MTPGINVATKAKVRHRIHEYEHDPAAQSYGLEASQKLGVPAEKVFKTLVVQLETRQNTGVLAVAVIPVSCQLSMKQIAKAAGAKKASMAEQAEVERATGYVLGGVSPLGQKKRLVTIVDNSAEALDSLFVSAGKRGLEIELAPADLLKLVNGQFAPICA